LVSVDARVLRNLGLKAEYVYKATEDPAYRTEPDNSDAGTLSASWSPFGRLSMAFGYGIVEQRRKDAGFSREARADSAFGSGTLILMKSLSATASYAYMKNEIAQDLFFGSALDSEVPYEDTTNVISVGLDYFPRGNASLHGGISHASTEGSFSPASPDLLQPVSVASFSELETAETVYTLSGSYRFRRGIELSADYRYSDFNDVLDNPDDDAVDGSAHAVLLSVSKSW
jgi:predicted porin